MISSYGLSFYMNSKHILKCNINKYTLINTKQIQDIELNQYRVAVFVITVRCVSACYVVSCFAVRCTQSHRLRVWKVEPASKLRNAWRKIILLTVCHMFNKLCLEHHTAERSFTCWVLKSNPKYIDSSHEPIISVSLLFLVHGSELIGLPDCDLAGRIVRNC